jgi:hypothetical protein
MQIATRLATRHALLVLLVAACQEPNDPSALIPTDSGSPGVPGLGANASLNGRRLFPGDNPWNQDISTVPVDANSATLIAHCGGGNLHPDFGTVWNDAPNGIPYVVVTGTQPRVAVTFDYDDESDAGPYPVPPNAPIEGGAQSRGDRHVLIVDRDNWRLYELFAAYPQNGGQIWRAGSGAIFDLNSNALRPAGWTSADAAGLPILAGLVRYDEVVEQEIPHALRFTCSATRRAYTAPARHFASSRTDASYPPMGMRVRLRADYDLSGFPREAQTILRALKRYGMFLADNGSAWYISGAPDPRWNDANLAAIKRVPSSAFDVVRMGAVVSN